jgi:1-phosphofructokinase
VDALFALREAGAEAAVVSRADQPALALLEDEVFEVTLPKLEPADHRGGGDSMTAGVAAVLAQGGDLPTAVKTGAAAGALNITRHGLGTGTPGAITQLTKRIGLEPLRAMERAAGQVSPDGLADKARPS